jgi:hypothetical protein
MDLHTNLQSLTQTRFDSGALRGLGAVAHRLTVPGVHRVTVLQADNPVHSVPLVVGQGGAPPAASPPGETAPSSPLTSRLNQLHVDLGSVLAKAGHLAPQPSTTPLHVGAEAYAMFSGPPNASGLAVQIHAPGAESQTPVFDSRQLGEGDVFALSVFRPGRYALRNAVTGAVGEVRVAYPVIGNTPYVPPDPFRVQVTDQGFQPSSIQLKPAQGLIFHVGKTKARIQIDLVEPDDGPARDLTPLHRWEKPSPPSA